VKRDRAALNHAVKEARIQAQELGARSEEAGRAIEALRLEVADLEARLRTRPTEAGPLIDWWAASLVALGLLVLAASVLLRGRAGRSSPPGSHRGSPGPREPVQIEVPPLVTSDR
jgi:hypothetical protein